MIGIRIYSRLGRNTWMSMSLGDYVRGAIGWAVIFVIAAETHDHWSSVKETAAGLWFIAEQAAGLWFAIWLLRVVYRHSERERGRR